VLLQIVVALRTVLGEMKELDGPNSISDTPSRLFGGEHIPWPMDYINGVDSSVDAILGISRSNIPRMINLYFLTDRYGNAIS